MVERKTTAERRDLWVTCTFLLCVCLFKIYIKCQQDGNTQGKQARKDTVASALHRQGQRPVCVHRNTHTHTHTQGLLPLVCSHSVRPQEQMGKRNVIKIK